MKILAHRGLWRSKNEQNLLPALTAALKNGFGIETDIRDHNGKLVVCHDLPYGEPLALKDFFISYQALKSTETLALNIKADGLQNPLMDLLKEFSIENYFVFDMSVPDMLGFRSNGMRFFSRYSEYEQQVSLEDEAEGIWLDCFLDDWSMDIIETFLKKDKLVCLVSPELHRRPHLGAWENCRLLMRNMDKRSWGRLMICTDFPAEAREYFA